MMNLAAAKIGGVRYNSPTVQVALVGFVAFCSVGMFSAVSNLGAGGTQDAQLSDTANGVLYGVFFVSGFIAGSINNLLGPRLTLSLGTTGYSLYVGSLWAYQVHGTRWFLILAGAILGFTAALLWSAQGCIMMSYPTEKEKGRAFSLFWSIFQAGTLVGSAIALGIQANSTLPTVSTGVYLAFMIIQLTAIGTSWLILPPSDVIRSDGTLVEIEKAPGPREEFRHFALMFKDWKMVAFFPMAFASNFFYAYQGAIVAFLFNGRTRALVALLTGLGSIVGAIVFGNVVDYAPGRRRMRSFIGLGFVLILTSAVWIGGLVFQVRFTRESTSPVWDWTDGAAVGPIILLMAYYIADASYQGLAYYTMSACSNDPFRLARMAGYYKGVQSLGAAVSFVIDATKQPYLSEHLASWLLLLLSLPFCAMILYKLPDSNYEVEKARHVEDLSEDAIHHAAVPAGHHTENSGGQVTAVGSREINKSDEAGKV